MPAIRKIVAEASRTNNHFSDLVSGIVKSAPFQMKQIEQPVSVAALEK